ncbi:uncharacterized protein LOC118407463 [Branchiostoma floridae]|uniref:Uncharacterized protein LOC118407463 n=1 Tax=Branchiostoma floridae TaxID=7739 RepID=A0A9J7KKN9_BRAFL|nr:uncharacterized protein LOC118407463 [Branchiostoma floridae]
MRRKEETAGKVNSDEPEETDPLEINGDEVRGAENPSDGDESLKVPEAGGGDEDGDNNNAESQPSSQTQHPPVELSDAEEEEEGGEEEEEDNNDAADNDEPDAKEEHDSKATSPTCTTRTANTGQREPQVNTESLTSDTEPTCRPAADMLEEATPLPPEACPGNGPTPVTVQVENAFAVQVGNGNVLISAKTEGSENATLTSGADTWQSHNGAEIVVVYIKNCDVVQVGNHNKVIPQENAYVKVCCELGIDPERADDILARLRHDDVRRQFAKKMADSFNVTCRIRAATRGCILLELEVPTEADRLQLLRMARDGTFQQVLLETFLPEFAAEGRAVNMNLAIGVRNPSQAVVEELQGATASSDKEAVKVIEIPDPALTDGSSTPGQPKSSPDQTEGQNQAENHVGVLEGPPDVDQWGISDEESPSVERSTSASETGDISQLTSLLRLLSEPGEDQHDQNPATEDQSPATDDQSPAADDQSPAADGQRPAPDDQSLDEDDLLPVDERLETNDQRIEVLHQDDPDLGTDDQGPASGDQHLETDDQSYDHSVEYESLTQEEPNSEAFSSSAHPEGTSSVTSYQVSERSGSEKTGDDEMTKVLRRLAVALDRREWEQVSQALRVKQPDKDLSADDTHLRVRILREWREGPSYREQFHGLLLALEACGRDDFAVELLQSEPHATHTAPYVPAASSFEDDYSEMSTQLKKAVPVFNQPRKPRKPPVDPRTPLRRLPFRLVKEIAMELDPPGQLVNWKDLAACTSFSMQEISLFEMEYLKPGGSPTRALLNAWGTRNATVRDLLDALRQIGLLNVVDMLSKAESDDEEA